MEQSGTSTGSKRFQPYARPAARQTARRPQQQQQPALVQDSLQNIPNVIVSFIKSTFIFLGFSGNDRDTLNEELNTTNGDFEILPAAHRDTTARRGSKDSGKTEETSSKLYPDLHYVNNDNLREKDTDLRDYLNSISSKSASTSKRPAAEQQGNMSSTQRSKVMKLLQDSQNEDNPMESNNYIMEEELTAPVKYEQETSESMVPAAGLKVSDGGLFQEDPDLAGVLSPAELRLLGNMRYSLDAPLQKARKEAARRKDTRLLEEILRRDHPAAYAISRHEQEAEPAPKPKPLDSILPYNKDHRRQRVTRAPTAPSRDHVMESGSGGSDADESEPPKNDDDEDDHPRTFHGLRVPRRSEIAIAGATAAAAVGAVAAAVHHHNKHQRTSRGGLQIKSQVTPERHVRTIPGRFSALDSDDEEEALRQYDLETERRKQQTNQDTYNTQYTQNVAPSYAPGPSQAYAGESYPRFPGFRVPPQLYPTLNYGHRTRLYHPRLEEAIQWTSSSNTSSKCDSCQEKTATQTSDPRSAPTATKVNFATTAAPERPSLFSQAATAVAATGVASSLFGAKDDGASKVSEKQSEPKTTASPALFTPSFGASPAGISTGKDKETTLAAAVPAAAGASIWGAPTDSNDKWKCPTCDVKNKNDLDKCPCCDTEKPGAKKATMPNLFGPATTTSSTTSVPSLFPPPAFGSSTSTSVPSAAAPTATPALFTFGAASSTSTDSSKAPTAAPLFGGFGTSSASLASKPAATPSLFGAPAVSSAAPSTPATGSIFSASSNDNKWKCPTCDVKNKPEDQKCPCCETAKPGASTAAAAPTPSLFSLKPPVAATSTPSSSSPSLFGGFTPSAITTSATDSATLSAPSFSFKPPVATSAAPSTPSTTIPLFGASATTTTAATDASKPPAFTFGTPADAVKEKVPPSFTFGGSGGTTSAPPAISSALTSAAAPSLLNPFAPKTPGSSASPSFVFGAASTPATSATSAAEEPKKSTAPAFTFGGSTASTSTPLFGAASSTSTPSPFGAATTTTAATTVSPLFGASTTSAAPSMSFGSTTSTFGALTSTAAVPAFGAASTTTTPSIFGATTGTTSAPLFGASSTSAAPASSSLFGLSSTSAPTTTPLFGGSSAAPAFGSSAASTTAAPMFGSTTTAPSNAGFTFGGAGTSSSSTSGGSFGGFGSANGTSIGFGSTATNTGINAANSMMSPPMSNATPATMSGATPSFSFGSGPVAFGGSSTPAFGGASAAPAFGALAPTSGFGSSASGAQSGGFGQSSFGTNNSQGMNSGGFGQTAGGGGSFGGFGGGSAAPAFGGSSTAPSTPAFGSTASSTPAFGSASGGSNGSFVTLANNPSMNFGGSSGGFGGGMMGNTQPGSFGFGGGATAPGGAQYTQPQSAMGAQGGAPGGGFAFNIGAAPDMPANRKIAKMRTKKRG
ncbi:hypothetical protein BGZ83_009682 [Gryganskiella cystojenkinii]|nr:hypothetical protein BGZ83_009682 [Gryganskiella cystojenkinii]